jgi:hypothetical protein
MVEKNRCLFPVWWYTLVVQALGRQRQEGQEFKASLDYRMRPYPPQKKNRESRKMMCENRG